MNKEDYIVITPNEDRWYDLKNLPNEYWEWIPYTVGYYKISNYGRILSIGRNGTRYNHDAIIKPTIKQDGYYQVVLKVNCKNYYRRVNRLMGETFLPNPNNLPIVDHNDNNKLNNCLYNLEWVSLIENSRRYFDNYFVSTNKGRGKIKPKKVNQYNIDGTFIKEYPSITEAAKVVYGNKSRRDGISKACRRNKNYLGYMWRYTEGGDVE